LFLSIYGSVTIVFQYSTRVEMIKW